MTPAQALALLVAKKQRLPRRRKPQLHLEPDSSAAALPVTPRGKQSSFWKTKQSPRASPQGAKRGRLQMLSARRGYPKQRSCLWQPKSAEGSATRKKKTFFPLPAPAPSQLQTATGSKRFVGIYPAFIFKCTAAGEKQWQLPAPRAELEEDLPAPVRKQTQSSSSPACQLCSGIRGCS